jgi:hypothetical protein
VSLRSTARSSAPRTLHSTEKLLQELLGAFREYDAEGDIVRVVDFDIKPGVTADEGDGEIGPRYASACWPATSW